MNSHEEGQIVVGMTPFVNRSRSRESIYDPLGLNTEENANSVWPPSVLDPLRKTTKRVKSLPPVENPFRKRLHKRLGGQFVAPAINDACERQLLAEEAGCSMARDVRLGTIEEVSPW